LYSFCITIFQTSILFETNTCNHGDPGAFAPVAPPLNPALSGSSSKLV